MTTFSCVAWIFLCYPKLGAGSELVLVLVQTRLN